jgi:hypothetical protein
MFIIGEHWKSDVEFFNEELDFLRRLVDKHYSTLVDEANMERTKSLISMLGETQKRSDILLQDVQSHMTHVSALFENPFAHDAQECKDEHENLETRVANFSRDFRSVKREAFALGKLAIESEKAKHLLKA